MTRFDNSRSYGYKKGKFTYLKQTPLINSILDVLAILKINSWAQPTTGWYDPKEEKWKKFNRNLTGKADISGIMWDGIRLEVECKTEKDRMRLNQKEFSSMIIRNKGLYIIARNIDDVLNELRKAGYIDWDGAVMSRTEKYIEK